MMRQTQGTATVIVGRDIRLRPMEETDRDALFGWSDNLQFEYFDVGVETAGYVLERLQRVEQGTSVEGYYFIIEYEDRPVGGCWLERADKRWILQEFPDMDNRSLGIYIAENDLWKQGVGTRTVRLLTQLAFDEENADIVFCCDVPDDDAAYKRALQSNRFIIYRTNLTDSDTGQKASHDFMLMRETYDDARID